ncbi:MAG: ATP-binding protein [Ferruginibacter sp.]
MTLAKSLFCVLLCMGLSVVMRAQTRTIDSLKRNIVSAPDNDHRLKAIFDLCDLGYTLHPDTLMSYAEMAKHIAVQQNNLHDEVQAMYYQSGALTTKGLIDSSLGLANKCLEILSSKVNDPLLVANVLNQKGRCYVRKNQYKEAISMGYQTIAAAEKNNDVLLQVKGKTLIGWAYLEMDQLKDALNWHLKALNTTTDTLLLEKYAILFANLATNYNGLGKTDSAFYYINKGISYSRKHENLFALSNSLAIESELYVKSGQAKLSEPVLKEVVAIRKIIGDPFYIASDMSQLGFYYAHYGQPEKGVAICKEGIAIARQYKLDTKLFFLYGSLADNYKAMGNFPKYAEVLEDIIAMKDSVYQKNSAVALAEMQTKYDLQKKENLIIQQELDIQRKNYLFYGSLAVLFFAAFISWFVFREYKRRQKIKVQKMQEDEKILSVIAVTKAEENERKRIAADLHDNLGAYAAAIASNIDQAGIHRDNEPALNELKMNAHSIVSQLNDTIWVLKKDNLSLTAISDRIKIFIQRIRASYPQINIDVIEHINTDLLLPPAQAFNLYQVSKEAISNALKHSGAANVRVYFESEKKWKISISDDGTGITALHTKISSGNGLINMKSRSKEAGWSIEWQHNEPHGTSVVIEPEKAFKGLKV